MQTLHELTPDMALTHDTFADMSLANAETRQTGAGA